MSRDPRKGGTRERPGLTWAEGPQPPLLWRLPRTRHIVMLVAKIHCGERTGDKASGCQRYTGRCGGSQGQLPAAWGGTWMRSSSDNLCAGHVVRRDVQGRFQQPRSARGAGWWAAHTHTAAPGGEQVPTELPVCTALSGERFTSQAPRRRPAQPRQQVSLRTGSEVPC